MCPDVAPNGTSDSLVPESTRFGDSRSEGPVNGKATELNDLGNALADTDTSDDDCRRFVISQEKPSTITEKKRLDNAAFRDWVVNTQREAMRNSLTAPDDLRNQSVSHLITASENRMIITTPREYQIELFERAKRENTIVVLPTGMFVMDLSAPYSLA
jgi:endoribonuclease Dicer